MSHKYQAVRVVRVQEENSLVDKGGSFFVPRAVLLQNSYPLAQELLFTSVFYSYVYIYSVYATTDAIILLSTINVNIFCIPHIHM